MNKVLKIGDSAHFSKTITEFDVLSFSGISGDFNPVHINEVEASKSMFKGRIAHGMLIASFISTTIATHIPGPGSIYLEQNLKFLKPVRIGNTVTANVKIVDVILEKNIYSLYTWVENEKGDIVIEGFAKILYKT